MSDKTIKQANVNATKKGKKNKKSVKGKPNVLEKTEKQLIAEFCSITQMGYGLFDIMDSVELKTTPYYKDIEKIALKNRKLIVKMIKSNFKLKFIENKQENPHLNLEIMILRYLLDLNGDFYGNGTEGRRAVNYCDKAKKHTDEPCECCFGEVYINRLDLCENQQSKHESRA